MTFLSESGLSLPAHDHPTDHTCHWVDIFRPVSFIVFRDAQLLQNVVYKLTRHDHGRRFEASDFEGYAKWLCEFGGNGLLNLMNVFLRICELRGIPSPPVVGAT
jgi:hypothetical protein